MTIMFCSFGDRPLILRLYGQGRVLHQNHPDWEAIHTHFSSLPGERQIIVLAIESVQHKIRGTPPPRNRWGRKAGESIPLDGDETHNLLGYT
ncbi:MAG: hypothetical protein ACFB8W_07970 [Elainellaceae cyanobacterium]